MIITQTIPQGLGRNDSPTFFALTISNPSSGNVIIGPATSADDSIPVFNGTNNKIIEASGWTITGGALKSPILANPSGDAILQRWGGVMTSGGQPGAGNTDVIFGMTRDSAGPSSTKISDNWGITYNRNLTANSPRYGWNHETIFDTSAVGGGIDGEIYMEHRIENGSGGPAAGSVVGGRIWQWNIGLPTTLATDPSAAAAYDAANNHFPGHVGLIGIANFWRIAAYDSAGAARGGFAFETSAAASGIELNSNTGYSYAKFTEWGVRSAAADLSIVGSTGTSFSMKNTDSTFGLSRGLQFDMGNAASGRVAKIINWENGRLGFTANGGSNAEGMCLTAGNRVLIGAGNTPTDSGSRLQVFGNGLFTSSGDTELRIVGGSAPVLKFIATNFSNGVDIQPDTDKFLLRISDNLPFRIQTQGTNRLNVHNVISSYAPLNVGPSATPGTNMARVKHGVATLVAGAVTVADTTVTANTRVFTLCRTVGGTQGTLRASNSAGVSFTITSTSGTDTSTVVWFMIEP